MNNFSRKIVLSCCVELNASCREITLFPCSNKKVSQIIIPLELPSNKVKNFHKKHEKNLFAPNLIRYGTADTSPSAMQTPIL